MKLVKPLVGTKVRLRALHTRDAEQCIAWLSDPAITRYMTTRCAPTLSQELVWIRRANRGTTDLVCAIEVRQADDSWKYIGNIGVHRIDLHDGTGEIGIFIGEQSAHGAGIATEAGQLLRAYLFGELGLFKIYARVYEPNFGSRRVCEKVGLKFQFVERRHVLRDGQRLDVYNFVAFADEQ